MKTISRVYDTYAQARNAVTDIEAAGVPEDQVSLVANKYVSEEYADVEEVSAPATGAGIGGAVSLRQRCAARCAHGRSPPITQAESPRRRKSGSPKPSSPEGQDGAKTTVGGMISTSPAPG